MSSPRKHMRHKPMMATTASLLAVCLSCAGPAGVPADFPPEETKMNLAFILLSKPGLPRAEEIVQAFTSLAPNEQRIRLASKHSDKQILEFEITPGGTAFVAAMPAPVPQSEADDAARFSVSAMGTGWTLPAHAAHLMVTLRTADSLSAIESMSRFTSLVAAVSEAAPAVGIYWGNAGATHDVDFFVSIARERGLVPQLMIWTGVSVAREPDGRVSLLSLGMKQLDLPDLLLVAPDSEDDSALATFFELLSYVAERGQAIPEGDTVGRTADERLAVEYVSSPIGPSKKVWRVELK